MEITIPHNWKPRKDQLPVFSAFDAGVRRFVLMCHRRWGKDDVCLHIAAKAMFTRVGNYWHMLPQYNQARRAIWDAVNPRTGKRRIDEAFPRELRKRTDSQKMFIEMVNGSTWQVLGSDNYDSLVGAPPLGIVFSEYALANPLAWDYCSPMLLENGGFAFFISTVRGYNHFYKLGEFARHHKDWFFAQWDADQTNVFSKEQLDNELQELISRWGDEEGTARFRQEYFNDPNAAIPGAYYAKWMTTAKKENRIGNVPYDPRVPVGTAWDLGVGDSTAIWFFQQVGQEIRIIDHYENSGQGLEHYAKEILRRQYVYFDHILPHDANVHELGTGRTRIDTLRQFGIKGRALPVAPIDEGIHAVRQILPRCWFDETKCSKGIDALINYQREYDEKLQTFKDRPRHDWASHSADAFRYLASGIKPVRERRAPASYSTDMYL